MSEIEGFDWDAANVGHIRHHAVTPFEVEEVVVGRPHLTIRAKTIQGEEPVEAFRKDGIRSWFFTIRRRRFLTRLRNECYRESRKYAPQID